MAASLLSPNTNNTAPINDEYVKQTEKTNVHHPRPDPPQPRPNPPSSRYSDDNKSQYDSQSNVSTTHELCDVILQTTEVEHQSNVTTIHELCDHVILPLTQVESQSNVPHHLNCNNITLSRIEEDEHEQEQKYPEDRHDHDRDQEYIEVNIILECASFIYNVPINTKLSDFLCFVSRKENLSNIGWFLHDHSPSSSVFGKYIHRSVSFKEFGFKLLNNFKKYCIICIVNQKIVK